MIKKAENAERIRQFKGYGSQLDTLTRAHTTDFKGHKIYIKSVDCDALNEIQN